MTILHYLKLSRKENHRCILRTSTLPINCLFNIAVRPQGTNNNSLNADQAEAGDPAFFATDPLKPDEVRLHSWMLYTPQAPMLNLTGEHIKTKGDIEAAFHSLNLCKHDEQKSDGAKGHKAKQSK